MGRIGREKMSKGGCGVRVVIPGGGSVQVVVPDGGGVDVQEEGKYQKENKEQEYLEAMIMAAHVAAAVSSAACLQMEPCGSSTHFVVAAASPGAVARMDRPRHVVVVRCEKKKKGAADEPAGEPGLEEGGDPHQDDTPFNYEINKIRGYWTEIHSAKISYLTEAHLRAQTPSGISLHTVDQTVRTYVSIFVKTAEDTYHRKVDRATILSFLCALQGLAADSHILFDDALAFVRSSQPDYSPKHDVDKPEASTTEALEILHSTVNDLTQKVASYVTKMTTLRKSTLAHVPGRTIASCDAAPPDDRQNE
uniref:Uncharacterized protein n=1 Tax=Oryza barthii TaxID=65489 RepID=A0A0D3GUS3_9ORYZ